MKKIETSHIDISWRQLITFSPPKSARRYAPCHKGFLISLQMSSLPLNIEQNVQKKAHYLKKRKSNVVLVGAKRKRMKLWISPKKNWDPLLIWKEVLNLGKICPDGGNCLLLGQKNPEHYFPGIFSPLCTNRRSETTNKKDWPRRETEIIEGVWINYKLRLSLKYK